MTAQVFQARSVAFAGNETNICSVAGDVQKKCSKMPSVRAKAALALQEREISSLAAKALQFFVPLLEL